MPTPSVAILGAGPVGLMAALRALEDGHDVTVYEQDRIGENVRSWGHVRMFSPWSMNASDRARKILAQNGLPLPDPEAYPTGNDLVSKLLVPLASHPPLRDRIKEGCRVLGVSREGQLKHDHVGSEKRASSPFRLLLEKQGEEFIVHADLVIDATGTFGHPNALGTGGIAAPGEAAARSTGKVVSGIPDVLGPDRGLVAGKSVLLLGLGHSAATVALALWEIVKTDPETRVTWAYRSTNIAPFDPDPNDPLVERFRIEKAANDLVLEKDERFSTRTSVSVDRLRNNGNALEVELSGPGGKENVSCDIVLSFTGFRPDDGLFRQLQIHQCYATFGPIKLAAALLGEGGGDCLTQRVHGVETLLNPEPNFYILGMKSYGTAPNFLIRVGVQQIEEVFNHIKEKTMAEAS